MRLNWVLLAVVLMLSSQVYLAQAKGVYQSNSEYIKQQLGELPKPEAIWLTKQDKTIIADILQHPFNRLRIKYWQTGNKRVFILNEVGKEKPITVGITIHQQQVQDVSVLAYRESRGDEVRHDFFTQQFKSSTLAPDLSLNKSIDGITGATLSVRALTKTTRLALFLSGKLKTNAGL